jgi:protein SCO1/2
MMAGSGPNLALVTQGHLHLLTGTLENIHKVTDAMGFSYYYNPLSDVIRHPTGSVVLTPNGQISSYTIGNDFPTKMLEASLTTAAQNKVSSLPADQSFMFGCVMIDPATGHIGFVVENIVRVACVITLLVFGLSVFRMLRNERKLTSPVGGGLS